MPPPPSVPPYSLRRNARSRCVRLRVQGDGRLIVTAPPRLPLAQIESWLAQQADWLQRHRPTVTEPALPHRIELPACTRTLEVAVVNGTRWGLQELPGERLLLTRPGAAADASRGFSLLRDWLRTAAIPVLRVMLDRLGDETGLRYTGLSVRDQRGRWGSCSSRGALSLNLRLLLLEATLLRHVLLHELCHTRHLHHGPAFWELLRRYDPALDQHRRALRLAWRAMPRWLSA